MDLTERSERLREAISLLESKLTGQSELAELAAAAGGGSAGAGGPAGQAEQELLATDQAFLQRFKATGLGPGAGAAIYATGTASTLLTLSLRCAAP